MARRDFYFGIILVVNLASKGIAASSMRSIVCPCGTKEKGINYTQLINNASDEKSACERWANCETCKANTTYCITCPPGHSMPFCAEGTRRTCPDPGIPEDGSRQIAYITENAEAMNFSVGEIVYFYCNNEDYDLEGVPAITCTSFGTWTDSTPRCRKPEKAVNGIGTACPDPGIPEGGNRKTADGNDDATEREYQEGESVYFFCNEEDSVLHGNSVLNCTSSGTWTASLPECKKGKVHCADPGSIQYGGVIVYFNEPMALGANYNLDEYPPGSKVSYNCFSGYRIIGKRDLYCRKNGTWSGEKPRCIEDCGVSSLSAGGKVTWSAEKTAGEFPWMVFLYMNNTGGTCFGVLLDHRTVLSAAHCFEGADYSTLYFGKYNRSDKNDDEHVETRTSSEIILHPEFDVETFNNDIAIVTFSPDVLYSSRIRPACMPSPYSTDTNLVPGQKGYIAGWGLNEYRVASSRLMLVTVPVQASETCTSSYLGRKQHTAITNGMYCAGFKDKKIITCMTMSGSPMVFFDNKMDRFTLEGLVSHGTNEDCEQPGMHIILTRVSHYLQWIRRYSRTDEK